MQMKQFLLSRNSQRKNQVRPNRFEILFSTALGKSLSIKCINTPQQKQTNTVNLQRYMQLADPWFSEKLLHPYESSPKNSDTVEESNDRTTWVKSSSS